MRDDEPRPVWMSVEDTKLSTNKQHSLYESAHHALVNAGGILNSESTPDGCEFITAVHQVQMCPTSKFHFFS